MNLAALALLTSLADPAGDLISVPQKAPKVRVCEINSMCFRESAPVSTRVFALRIRAQAEELASGVCVRLGLAPVDWTDDLPIVGYTDLQGEFVRVDLSPSVWVFQVGSDYSCRVVGVVCIEEGETKWLEFQLRWCDLC